jgi:transmembrane sensor
LKDYSTFDAVDFAQDDHFIKWTKYPGKFKEIDLFWETWLTEHPAHSSEVQEAKDMIQLILDGAEHYPIAIKQQEIWHRIQSAIQNERLNIQKSKSEGFGTVYKIAATILLVVSFAFVITWVIVKRSKNEVNDLSEAKAFSEFKNGGNIPQSIILSDGSSVVLQPNGSLRYPLKFTGGVREVQLKGEAFFEIAKDAKKPFLVYANQLITKVLGTSFVIRARDDGSNISVQVRTGKVSVFTKEDMRANQSKSNSRLEGLVLTPNQQVIFSPKDSKMVKSLVDNPMILNHFNNSHFIFRDAPLKTVFQNLEQAYGIQIIYDEELISKCFLNASLDEMPLYDKMRLICKGLNGQYEILDSHIIFTSKGCK